MAEARDAGDGVQLTAREVEVLRLVTDGRSDRAIGVALFISQQTASTHVRNILRKLAVPSRTAAAMAAIQQGLIERTPG
jgi:DNA-binding NarL/FixJ family response regulator